MEDLKLQAMSFAVHAFECLSDDTLGGYDNCNSNKIYFYVIIDHVIRYGWAFPSKSATS